MTDHKQLILTSPENSPVNFTIVLEEDAQATASLNITITGEHAVTHAYRSLNYTLPDKSHQSYLDFFNKLSTDFGLRLPQNERQPAQQRSSDTNYTTVLTENITERMLYGYGDPAVIRVEDDGHYCFYLLVTSNDAPDSFPILGSDDLITWKLKGFVFPKGNKPLWAADGEMVSDYWAPEMHRVGTVYRVYFVARHKHTFELCIGKAESHHPEGPFVADAQPIITGNVIDPHIYVDKDEAVYLYWKEDNNDVWPGLLIDLLHKNPALINVLFDDVQDQATAAFIVTLWPWTQTMPPMERFMINQILIEAVIETFSEFRKRLSFIATESASLTEVIKRVHQYMRTPIYAQRLSSDGTNLEGERIKILENDQDWEAHLVEGMWVTKHDDRYYLFYAGNDFSTDHYGIGVAVGDSPVGPFTKMSKPFLQSTDAWWAPGHPSVVTAPDGRKHLFLHAYFPGKAGYKKFRALLRVPLVFENGTVSAGKQ